ncbi:unnamed protein product [Bursaphelenchus okinawaensis]|uniref:RNase NYN domain-containing protein n=1 Tax=Bursaphelenchus okinawaensis TaxID=465554 RepID=A0A811KRR2_9BILA|nr:unnamed protein product [Bursaphelenchus okinawaensis]CAG9112387.1 unnamed protein product [Bursaphelenchus okinawaensis]
MMNDVENRNQDNAEAAIKQKLINAVRRIPPQLFVSSNPESVNRLIVIDGCNVGRASCGPGREHVNCLGLLAIARFWIVRDFDVVIFIPVTYNNPQNQNVAHSAVLPKLQTLGILGFTSARTTGTRRRSHMNYDDLYVLDFAERHGGAVLSGDYFEDILQNGEEYQGFRDIIKRRRIGVRFHPFGEAFARINSDHFYRCCPEIHTLSGNDDQVVNSERLHPRLFASPSDVEFEKALRRRESAWSPERRQQLLDGIDGIIHQLEQSLNALTVVVETVGRPRTLYSDSGVNNQRPCATRSSHNYYNPTPIRPRGQQYRTSPTDEYMEDNIPHQNRSSNESYVTGANAVPLSEVSPTYSREHSRAHNSSTLMRVNYTRKSHRSFNVVSNGQRDNGVVVGGIQASTVRIQSSRQPNYISRNLFEPLSTLSSSSSSSSSSPSPPDRVDPAIQRLTDLWNSLQVDGHKFGEEFLKLPSKNLVDLWLNEKNQESNSETQSEALQTVEELNQLLLREFNNAQTQIESSVTDQEEVTESLTTTTTTTSPTTPTLTVDNILDLF